MSLLSSARLRPWRSFPYYAHSKEVCNGYTSDPPFQISPSTPVQIDPIAIYFHTRQPNSRAPPSPSLSAHLLPSLKSPIPSPIPIEASSINKKWSVSRIKMGKLSYIKYHNPTAVVIVASMVIKTRVDTVGFSSQAPPPSGCLWDVLLTLITS
ncbi:hypothetical protein PS1_019969 [Malus domestica]